MNPATCPYCNISTNREHEWNCPYNSNYNGSNTPQYTQPIGSTINFKINLSKKGIMNKENSQIIITKQQWKNDFIKEFGLHFSKSELLFVLEFIEELLEAKKQEEQNKWHKAGWNDYRKEIISWAEKLDTDGGGSGRRFKTQLLEKLKEI